MLRFTLFFLLGVTASCSQILTPPPVVRIAVSVDWEGREITEANLAAFDKFHEAHPDVPLTQFLNAAYYVKDGADADAVTAQIRRALGPNDELGLHIHPWRSLVEASGVVFRAEPTVWGMPRPERAGWPDPGHDVVLEAYEVDELVKVVQKSKEILSGAGFELSQSFRAGAWLAGPKVREAIRREGFLVDTSATDASWHDEIDQYALPDMVREIWPGVTKESQPFVIQTPAGELLEMPDTCALADYVTAEEMADHIADVIAKMQATQETRYAHIGFHLETAAKYGDRVIDAIEMIKLAHGDAVVFETLENSAAVAANEH